jgi:hypothetical protein
MKNKRRISLLVLLVLMALSVHAQFVSPRRNLGTSSGNRNVGTDLSGRFNRRSGDGSQTRSNERNRTRAVEAEQQKEKKQSESVSKASADEVSLVVSGEGTSREEATKVALRSAIEQAFGTFVSSNTQILDDELVKDEIVTVSSGNVKSYKILSESVSDNVCNISLQAVVSIGKLVSYTQSKGGSTELAGATFAMDVKMKKLQAENEKKAFEHLLIQLKELMPTIFDFSIKVSDPSNPRYYSPFHAEAYRCAAVLTAKTNNNYNNIWSIIWNTLNALRLDESEVDDYKAKGIRPSKVVFSGKGVQTMYFRSGDFFCNLSKFPQLMLNSFSFVIDDGIEKSVFKCENITGGKFIAENKRGAFMDIYIDQLGKDNTGLGSYNCDGGGRIMYFPVMPSAQYELKGELYYKLEEIEKLNKISVKSTDQ